MLSEKESDIFLDKINLYKYNYWHKYNNI